MKTQDIKLQGKHGLHLRVAGEIAKVAQSHKCKVSVSCHGCKHADGCSVMQLLTLDASDGSTLRVSADGPDEEAVLSKLEGLLTDGGGI